MLQLARGFAQLQKLHVQHLPCLAPGVLRAVGQIAELQHLRLSCTAASGTLQELLSAAAPAAAAAGGGSVAGETSSAGSGVSLLKSLVLHVPAGRMPSAGAAAVAPTPAAAAAAGAGAAGPPAAAAAGPAGELQAASDGGTWLDLQQALLQRMPWASVRVVADQCLR